MDDRPIGIFDSGLGGLSIARALIDLLPDERLVYFGDTGRFPYGPKPRDEVAKYAMQITELLVDRGVKMVVVGCNSAAAAALADLQATVEVPVIGVIEPGLRAAEVVTRSGKVGVIGTMGTIVSGAYEQAARSLGSKIELSTAACPGFVEFVEAGEVDSDQVRLLALRLLAPVRRASVDTLILGCTHYPLMARTIGDVMGRDVVLVSSGEETAFEVREILRAEGQLRDSDDQGNHDHGDGDGDGNDVASSHVFITSGDPQTFAELGARFCGPEVSAVEAWSWT